MLGIGFVCLFVRIMSGIGFVCFLFGGNMFSSEFVCFLCELCWALGLSVSYLGEYHHHHYH